MSPPLLSADDYSDYVALAGRIRRHLQANPTDRQAQDDLRYVVSKMRGPLGATAAANAQDKAEAEGPQTSNPTAAAAAGLSQAVLDIPRGVAQAILHPIQTAGQLTGIGNWGKLGETWRDPEAGAAEKIGAVLQATPLNMGYAPERALLEATGAKSETPSSVEEQFHRGGNVASLALLGVKPTAPLRLLRGGVGRVLGSGIGRGLAARLLAAGAPKVAPTAEEVGPAMAREMGKAPAPYVEPVHPDALQAMRDYAAGKITGEDLTTAMDVAAGRTPHGLGHTPLAVAPSVPTEIPRVTNPEPIPGAPQGLTAVGPPTPAPPTTPTVAEMQPQVPRSPLDGLGTGKTLPYYSRGGKAAQAMPPGPATSPVGPSLAPGQLKTLLDLPPEEFEAASGMLAPDVMEQVRSLRQGGATAAHVDATVSKLGAPTFSGAGFQGTAAAMQHPAYQQASILAGRILRDPALLKSYPQFAGATPQSATTILQRMLLEHAQRGGAMPPITSLAQFLRRVSP